MIHKIAYLGDNTFQLDDQATPLDETSVKELASSLGQSDVNQWITAVKEKGLGELYTEAVKGVVVDVYEVEYAPPKDPTKETQMLAGSVDDYNDFVTQYVFPSTEVKDVFVGLQSDIQDDEKTPNNFHDQHKKHVKSPSVTVGSQQGWRQVLSVFKLTEAMEQAVEIAKNNNLLAFDDEADEIERDIAHGDFMRDVRDEIWGMLPPGVDWNDVAIAIDEYAMQIP